MLREARPFQSKFSRFVCSVGIGILLCGLSMGVVTGVVSASAYKVGSQEGFAAPVLQVTATPTATPEASTAPTAAFQAGPTSTFSFSLASLGYDEVVLNSPYDQFQYSFDLPESWAVQTDAIFDLDLSYVYSQANTQEYPSLFGELMVAMDDQTLDVLTLDESEFDHHQWRVTLPASLLASPTRHTIDLTLRAGHLCEVPHQAKLVIRPTSSITVTYGQSPLVLNLARYPWPFHQQAFEPDGVRIVLSSEPTAGDLSNALAVAAKLGDLTGGGVVISATSDVDLSHVLSVADPAFDENLIVIGRPQDNQLLSLLNQVADLPVSLHQQQLGLLTQGPANIAPGDVFSYTFTITNTLDRPINLSLISSFAPQAELSDCSPLCTVNSNGNLVTWDDNRLAPAETTSFSLVLEASDLLTGTTFENTATLVESDLGPVSADTLGSAVVGDSSRDNDLQMSVAEQDGYFFVYAGRAVAEEDGIIQEILSPWSENHAILIVTGLSDEAVRKASLAMSSEARFPGMRGPVALVRGALSPSEIQAARPAVVEMTFGDLGYADRVVRGGGSIKKLDYFFRIPYGWQLTEDAAIDLYFGHSGLINYEDSGLTVLLNEQPIASTALNEETENNGHLRVSLAHANVQMGDYNRLTLEVDAALPGVCVDDEQAWVVIKNSSSISLAHRELTGFPLVLDFFPHPFNSNPSLTNLAFVLPAAPAMEEWGAALRLAVSLGSSAAGKTMAPIAMLDNDLSSQALADYHIVALGRPSHNALIEQVNSQLPQPFLPGTDEIDQRLDDVVFRLPPGVNLGYLQMIPSPWNEAHALLAVTGTTDQGVKRAVEVLTDEPWALGNGNLALVRDLEVSTIDTRRLTRGGLAAAVVTAVPEMTPMAPEAAAAASPTAAPPSPSPAPGPATEQTSEKEAAYPAWLIPLVAISGVVVLAIFAFAFWQSRREKP